MVFLVFGASRYGGIYPAIAMILFGEFLQTLGEIFVALTILFVHRRVWKQHTIDTRVLIAATLQGHLVC